MAKFGVVFYKMCGKLKTATSTTKYFYELYLSSNLKDNYSFEETLAELCEIDNVSDLNLTRHSILEGEVSEESYNNLVDYVLEQVNLEGANVLNVTKFEDVDGRNETNLIAELNGIIYNVNVNLASFGTQEDHIENLLDQNRTETITVTSEENFLPFETIGEAQEYFNSLGASNRFCQTINGEKVEFEISQNPETGKFNLNIANWFNI